MIFGARDMMNTSPKHWSRAFFKLGLIVILLITICVRVLITHHGRKVLSYYFYAWGNKMQGHGEDSRTEDKGREVAGNNLPKHFQEAKTQYCEVWKVFCHVMVQMVFRSGRMIGGGTQWIWSREHVATGTGNSQVCHFSCYQCNLFMFKEIGWLHSTMFFNHRV